MATALKMSDELKARIQAQARRRGISAHAYMLGALEDYIRADEARDAFVAEALEADAEMERTGAGYDVDEVLDYLEAKVRGEPAQRPEPKRCRE